ncbi:ZN282 protein, partial [Oxylabes madagascariensis]|nr:ZN282 protein [Oxylabes madagascariensis]
CTECGKRFRLKINLIIHQRSHAKEGPYECPVCEIGFSNKRHLDLHHSIHVKDRAFGAKCPYCKKFLSCSMSLQRHLQTHARERPYCCSSCNKCFTRSNHLLRHKKIH